MKKLFAVFVALLALLVPFVADAQVSGFPSSPRLSGVRSPNGTIQIATPNSGVVSFPGSQLSNASTANFVLGTNGGQGQLALVHAAGANTVTITSGTNPTISTTAGNLNVGTTLTSTKACAANYTRIGPNFCLGSPFATSVWTNAAACTARTFPNALPAEAKAVVLHTVWRALAGNAIGDRNQSINSFSTGACTGGTATANLVFRVREQVATAAGTDIGEVVQTMIIPLTATNTFASTQLNAGGNGNAEVTSYGAVGYFD